MIQCVFGELTPEEEAVELQGTIKNGCARCLDGQNLGKNCEQKERFGSFEEIERIYKGIGATG